ncbi:MAG: hypothetical protein QF863_08470, partial [Pseudomonadales bacterium]|nr:hypothetical protein [Pseudomonadales bacterium]
MRATKQNSFVDKFRKIRLVISARGAFTQFSMGALNENDYQLYATASALVKRNSTRSPGLNR